MPSLISVVTSARWIDLSEKHKQLREYLESSIEAACVDNKPDKVIMIKGAFGISDKILDEDIINELVKELNVKNVKTINFDSFKKFVIRAFEDDNLDSKSKAKSKKSKFKIYDKKDNVANEENLNTSTKITI